MRSPGSTPLHPSLRPTGRVVAAIGLSLACVVGLEAGGHASGAPAQDGSAAETLTPSGRDLAQVDVCVLVPGEAVAAALGGTLEKTTGSAHGGFGLAADCTYTVRVGRRTAVALVSLYPPHRFEALRGVEDVIETVPGVGDEAYSTKTGGMHQLTVLKRGDVTIDARAHTERDARRLAELALSRL